MTKLPKLVRMTVIASLLPTCGILADSPAPQPPTANTEQIKRDQAAISDLEAEKQHHEEAKRELDRRNDADRTKTDSDLQKAAKDSKSAAEGALKAAAGTATGSEEGVKDAVKPAAKSLGAIHEAQEAEKSAEDAPDRAAINDRRKEVHDKAIEEINQKQAALRADIIKQNDEALRQSAEQQKAASAPAAPAPAAPANRGERGMRPGGHEIPDNVRSGHDNRPGDRMDRQARDHTKDA